MKMNFIFEINKPIDHMQQEKKLKKPIFTILLTLTCCTIYFLFQYYYDHKNINIEYSHFGAPYAIQIYEGQYWGVFSNSFLHTNLYHLIFNLIGLWILGAFIEKRIGLFNFILLGFFASTITSIAQLALSNDAGLGLTGVNFFFIAYIITKSFKSELFAIRAKYIYLILALVGIGIAYYLNEYQSFNIGIEAMVAGLFYGTIVGLSTFASKKIVPIIFSVLLLITSCITLFYAPWSAEWNYFKGYTAHEKGDYETAKFYYKEAIKINPKHHISLENLRYISIDEISDMALQAHKEENYLLARKLYERVLKLDPNNQWAKENIAKLP